MPANFDLTWLNKNPAELLSFLSSLIPPLESGFKLAAKTITYSFYTSAVAPPESEYTHLPEGQSPVSTPFTEREKTTTRSLLEYLSNVVNLNFHEVNAGEGMLRFDHVNMTVGGYANFPGQEKGWSVVFVSDANVESYYALHTLYHEIGHALGLKHPRDYSASPEPSPSLPEDLDTCALSLLSYDATATNTSYAALDYAALLYIYGPSEQTYGIEYRFTNSGTALTFDIKDFGQKFSDNSFATPFSPDSVFWVFGTKGWDSVNLSKFAASGSVVDAQNGKIAVSTDPISAIYVLDFMHNQWTVPDVTGFANIHLYPADNINSFPVEALMLGNGTNAITLGSSFKTITGGAGSDNFSGFASISIDGGDGFDTWALVSNRADYALSGSHDATSLTNAGLGTVDFAHIERVSFSDGSYLFDIQNTSANTTIYRLYRAALGRVPDEDGFRFWIEAQAKNGGMPAITIATLFENSNESRNQFGQNLTNREYITKLYSNTFGRKGDVDGTNYWVETLDSGTADREHVMIAFANSAESINVTAQNTNLGYWLT